MWEHARLAIRDWPVLFVLKKIIPFPIGLYCIAFLNQLKIENIQFWKTVIKLVYLFIWQKLYLDIFVIKKKHTHYNLESIN